MIPEFTQIKSLLPELGWFIAGGSLLSDYYNDVDVYFYSEADYNAAVLPNPDITTDNAVTYLTLLDTRKNLQLINRNFGTPDEILANFDLNKSRQALLPSGELYQHPTFHADLYFDLSQFRGSTLDRLTKYVINKHQIVDIPKLQSNIAQLLTLPLDTKYEHYYNPSIEVSLVTILHKFISDYFVSLSFLFPVFEALSPQSRLDLYSAIIDKYTHIIPLDSMSAELQAISYLNQSDIAEITTADYTTYRNHETSEWVYPSSYEARYPYPLVTLPIKALQAYPELFI